MLKFSQLATAAAALWLAAAAQAAPPANVANTTWLLVVDGGAPEELFIDTQNGPGAPGNANCRGIRGNLPAAVPVSGWYCPATGRIHLLHKNKGSKAVVRSFMGNVSDEVAGQPLTMQGDTAIENAAFGDLGEVLFSATRQ